jgi:hypothetical protein
MDIDHWLKRLGKEPVDMTDIDLLALFEKYMVAVFAYGSMNPYVHMIDWRYDSSAPSQRVTIPRFTPEERRVLEAIQAKAGFSGI